MNILHLHTENLFYWLITEQGHKKAKDDVAPEMQSKVKTGNETEERLFVVEYEDNDQ